MKNITTKEEYIKCMKRMDEIFHTNNEDEIKELEQLAKLVGEYEESKYPAKDINFSDIINLFNQENKITLKGTRVFGSKGKL